MECPICGKKYPPEALEAHANRCLDMGGQAEEDSFVCGRCGGADGLLMLSNCVHIFCRGCLRAEVMARVAQRNCERVPCLERGCEAALMDREIRSVLGPEEIEMYDQACILAAMGGDATLVRCPNAKCGFVVQLEVRGSIPEKEIDDAMKELGPNGKPLSRKAAEHRCRYRLRCRECATEFCGGCSATPYHMAFDCQEFASYGQTKHCRFCGESIPSFKDVCDDEECVRKQSIACPMRLGCGHMCCGIRGEWNHLPCLDEECGKKLAQTGDTFCNICFVDVLRSAPTIMLECGHMFHYECVREKISKGWPTPRITFGFLECPLCRKQISHPSLTTLLQPWLAIKAEVEKRALERLQMLGLDKTCTDITQPDSRFYRKPLDYAMYQFSFFQCYKCKKPYYGGERACEIEEPRDFKPEDLQCASCCDFAVQSNCPIHGPDFIQWKCRFCCRVAVFFCWGTTHFCEVCHKTPGKMCNMPRSQLPKCDCNIPHPPNGEECLLGCSLCRLEHNCFK